MSYEKLNLKDGNVWKAEHVDHLEEGIIANEINLHDADGIGSLIQTKDTESWNPTNQQVIKYITDNIGTADDGHKIQVNDDGSIKVGAYGKFATSLNGKSQSIGKKSFTNGSKNIAFESNAHAEGNETFAAGKHSHAEGNTASALGNASHSEGVSTIAKGLASHAEGSTTNAEGETSHAEGSGTKAIGYASHSEGSDTKAIAGNSHVEGHKSVTYGDVSHTEGYQTSTYGYASHAEGNTASALGYASHSEGISTIAKGLASHAEGSDTNAIAGNSHAEGHKSVTYGDVSHTEGYQTSTYGYASHAEGYSSNFLALKTPNGDTFDRPTMLSWWEDYPMLIATGVASHAEGQDCAALGNFSHAQGLSTVAYSDNQLTLGRYNEIDTNNGYSVVVGNGESEDSRSNALTVDWSGNAKFAGTVETTGIILISPNKTRFKLLVDDSGKLSTEQIIEE